MSSVPTIYADFNNADGLGRFRLNCLGSLQDLAKSGLKLTDGLAIHIADCQLQADATVMFSH